MSKVYMIFLPLRAINRSIRTLKIYSDILEDLSDLNKLGLLVTVKNTTNKMQLVTHTFNQTNDKSIY